MKKIRFPLIPLALLILLFSVTACGSSSISHTSYAAPSSAPSVANYQMAEAGAGFMSDMASPEMDVSSALKDISSQRKIVKHSNLSLETKDFDTAIFELRALVQSAGGYIESQNVNGISLYNQSRYNERTAFIFARIPSDSLNEVVNQVGALCNIVSQGERMDDITDSYYDTQARLDSLELQEERLMAILEKAEKLEEVITLERALSDTRYQIESLTASMKRMDSQVAYSYLNIDLTEVVEYQAIESLPKSFGERVSISWGRSLGKIQREMEGLLFSLIEDGPLFIIELLLLGVVIFVVVCVLRKIKAVTGFKLKKKTYPAPFKTEKKNADE